MRDLLAHSAHISILDLSQPPSDLSPSSSFRFFKTDISNAEEVEKAVEETIKWSKETGAVLGGAICAAGVATIGKVRSIISELPAYMFRMAHGETCVLPTGD